MGDLSRGQTSDPIDGRVFKANEKLSRMDSAGDTLEDWDGDAAYKFMENFLDTFEYVSTNQFLVLSVMKMRSKLIRKGGI